jgi:BirA family biotin operon repressor/biotin-[acetyl-CoA-carboxylase] ligase
MKTLEVQNPWGAPVLYRERTRSTMEDALELARRGYPEGTTVVADYQEGGRGRLEGRRWHAEAGRNLLFTTLLPPGSSGEEPTRVPLLVGLAVSRALEASFGLAPAIKWPNDVLCEVSPVGPVQGGGRTSTAGGGGGRTPGPAQGGDPAPPPAKVAGILCEAVVQGEDLLVLAGVGVNCNQLDFPGESAALSLARLLGREVDRAALLAGILAELRRALQDAGWKEALLERLYLLGREVTVRVALSDAPALRRVRGILTGLGNDGSLEIRLPGGEIQSVYSGELERAG